jgi:hypothetical protein
VRSKWTRPAWCKDEWLKVRLPNGYGYYSPVSVVQIDDEPGVCWVRANAWKVGPGGAEVRFTDFSGEGSLDTVYKSDLRAIG